MPDPITLEQLENAAEDADVLGQLMNDAPGNVESRTGRTLYTYSKIQQLGTAAAADAAASAASLYNWEIPHTAQQNAPPVSPSAGDRYMVGASPTGAWAGKPNEGAYYASSTWNFSGPPRTKQRATIAGVLSIFETTWKSVEDVVQVSMRPAFIDLFFRTCFGRGMIEAEAVNVTTEAALAVAAAAGDTTLKVNSLSDYAAGGLVAVKHDDGTYDTYFATQKGVDSLTIRPPLRKDMLTSAARAERGWYNRAHAGKFVMRHIAQRIAHGTEVECALPNGDRTAFANFATNANTYEDTLIAVGGGSISYYDGDSENTTTDAPPRFLVNRTAYVDVASNGDGAKTQFFPVSASADYVLNTGFMCNSPTPVLAIQALDESGNELGRVDIPNGEGQRVAQLYPLRFNSRNATDVQFKLTIQSGGTSTNIQWYFVDMFRAPETDGPIIAKRDGTIVVFGDSWAAGLDGTADRESISTQLALELPRATVINEGVGGDSVEDLLDRFDADVETHAPDYVVVVVGTNNMYSPSSSVFDTTATLDFNQKMNKLINKISALKARPIIVGIPGLAQVDTDFTSVTNATWAADVLTITTPYDYGYTVGKTVRTKGFLPVALNGDFTTTSGTTGTTIKYALVGDPGTITQFGHIEWVLNDRARLQNQRFMEGIAKRPSRALMLTRAQTDLSPVLGSTAALVKDLNSGRVAFSVKMATTVSDVTGDGTEYTIVFDTEQSDVGAVFGSGTTFTAPVAGLYRLGARVTLLGLLSGHTQADLTLVCSTAGNYFLADCNPYANALPSGENLIGGEAMVSLAQGETVTLRLRVHNSTKVVDVLGSSSNLTQFYGFQVK